MTVDHSSYPSRVGRYRRRFIPANHRYVPTLRQINRHGISFAVPYVIVIQQAPKPPCFSPQIVTTPTGPAVVHSNDFAAVTAAKPAKAGEILTLDASNLGPTRPGVDPGQHFTADPLQAVNSPVQVLVNGRPGEVLYAGGYPGAVDGYQVKFRIPDGTAPSQASLQLTSAWILGPAAKIPVQ